MESLLANATPFLVFLLPGFLTAWVYCALTSHPKLGQFERTIEALVFTFIDQAIAQMIETSVVYLGDWWGLRPWELTTSLAIPLIVATSLGIALAAATNRDTFHAWLRRHGLTSRTSHPSQWYSVLDARPAHVILQLHDTRRLAGWPSEWPMAPDSGQFYIQRATWTDSAGCVISQPRVDGILVQATDVRWVEILHATEGESE